MVEILLSNLLPSLLIFSGIGFSIMLALPRFRFWIKEQLDQKLEGEETSIEELFTFYFYLEATRFLDPIAFLYLVSGFLILITPYILEFGDIALWILISASTFLIVHIVYSACSTLKKIFDWRVIIPQIVNFH